MKSSANKSSPTELPAAVQSAVDAIIDELKLRPSSRRALLAFVTNLQTPFPKLDHVSFFNVESKKSGSIGYRIEYTLPGRKKRRTERLGKNQLLAYQRAQRVNDILCNVKARLMKPDDAFRLLAVDSTPIENHVRTFESHLKSKGSKPKYIKTTMVRLRRCIELGDYQRLGDITREGQPELIADLKVHADPLTGRRLSDVTVNDYLAVLRQFTKWATPTLIQVDPLVNSAGIKAIEENPRRNASIPEVGAIVAAAKLDKSGFKMRGADRAMLYLVAYATGLRANELRSVKVPWLKLDGDEPHIVVPATDTKNSEVARQPIPSWLVPVLREWLGNRKSGPLFPTMPRDVQVMFEADRATARAEWLASMTPDYRDNFESTEYLQRVTVDGEITFHSLRHAYASTLLEKGLDLKSTQLLTRHANVATLEKYAHANRAKASGNVEKTIVDPRQAPVDGAVNKGV